MNRPSLSGGLRFALLLLAVAIQPGRLYAQCLAHESAPGSENLLTAVATADLWVIRPDVSLSVQVQIDGDTKTVAVEAHGADGPMTLEGHLRLHLDDGQRVDLPLLHSTTVNPEQRGVSPARFVLTETDVSHLMASGVARIAFKSLGRGSTQVQVGGNNEVLRSQLNCLHAPPAEVSESSTGAVPDEVHPLEKKHGFQRLTLGDPRSLHASKLNWCHMVEDGGAELCMLTADGGHIGDIPYGQIHLYFVSDKIAKILIDFRPSYRRQLLSACRAGFGVPTGGLQRNPGANGMRVRWRAESVSLSYVYSRIEQDETLQLSYEVGNYGEIQEAYRQSRYSIDDF